MPPHTIQDAHPDALVLASKLEEVPEGETITYAALSAAIAGDVQRVARPRLQTARRIVMREHRIVFGTIRDVGLTRLAPPAVVRGAGAGIQRVRRHAHREMRKLMTLNSNTLAPEDQVRWVARTAMFGVLRHIAKPRRLAALEDRVRSMPTVAALPLAATLDVFRNGKEG